jgi:hypothetical protein
LLQKKYIIIKEIKIVRKQILMPVYNEIEYDGRVQRAAEALSEVFKIIVFSIDSGNSYYNNAKFSIKVVSLQKFKYYKGLKHLYFWLKLWFTAIGVQPHIVYAHDYFMALPGWIAARLSGAKFIYDAHELIIPDKYTQQNWRNKFWCLIEKWVIKKADFVIAANLERAEIMQSYYCLNKTPLAIRNIPPIPRKFLRKKETLKHYPILRRNHSDIIRLVYQGDMSLARRIDMFISAMKYLDEQFELLLIGDGPDIQILKQKAKSEGIKDKVIFIDKVSRDYLYNILKTCDIGIIAYPEKGMNNIYCAPNKLYEYTQAGLPIIATYSLSLETIINIYKIGVMVGSNQQINKNLVKDIVAKINYLVKNYRQFKINIPKFLCENNWEEEKRKLLNVVTLL